MGEDSLVTDGELAYLTPEAKARVEIDRMLGDAGWTVQHARSVNLSASLGVAVREFVLRSPHGRANYLLFVDGAAAGVVEAKPRAAFARSSRWVDSSGAEKHPHGVR